jgi:SAM-dependent methyltransferase
LRIVLSLTSIPSSSVSSSESIDTSCPVDGCGGGVVSGGLDFSRRAELVELMDQPCSYEEFRACLIDIGRVNRLTFEYRPTVSWIANIIEAHRPGTGPLRVVDVGCGYGDTLRRIDGWAKKRGVPVALTGVDLNPDAIRAAREATSATQCIEWVVGDALSNDCVGDCDVVLCSLLTHHMTNPQIVKFLSWLERTARLGWFVNDLHRQPVPYHLFRLLSRFTNWHRFVKHDGPVSIRRSFVVEDWQELCSAAGLASEAVSIAEYRPARLCVGRIK